MVFPFVSDRSLIVGSRSSFPRSLESPTREMWLIVTLYATCLADCLNALNIIPGKACGLQTEVKTADRSLSASDIMRTFVNILCSAEQSSAYCHYSSFFGRHNHSIFTPRGDIEYQYSPLGVILNIKNIRSNILHSTLVLWRQKTWNNGRYYTAETLYIY